VIVNNLIVVIKNIKDSDKFRIKISSLFNIVNKGEYIFYLRINIE
jgi:hypothetical protein